MIGQRERRHAQLGRSRHEVAQARQCVEKAVLAVGVQVEELFGDRRSFSPLEEARGRLSLSVYQRAEHDRGIAPR